MSGNSKCDFFDPAAYAGDKIKYWKMYKDNTERYHGYKACYMFVLRFESGRKLRFVTQSARGEYNYFLVPKDASLKGKSIGKLKEISLEYDNHEGGMTSTHGLSLKLNDGNFYFFRVCVSKGSDNSWFYVEEECA
jgi:hypothetical protein